MSDVKHTAEPWKVSLSDNATPHILSGGTYDDHLPEQFICVMPAEILKNFNSFNNARRIVACVNHCAGIETEKLETSPFSYLKMLDHSKEMRAQRDKLLAGLKETNFLLRATLILISDAESRDIAYQQLSANRALFAEIEATK